MVITSARVCVGGEGSACVCGGAGGARVLACCGPCATQGWSSARGHLTHRAAWAAARGTPAAEAWLQGPRACAVLGVLQRRRRRASRAEGRLLLLLVLLLLLLLVLLPGGHLSYSEVHGDEAEGFNSVPGRHPAAP